MPTAVELFGSDSGSVDQSGRRDRVRTFRVDAPASYVLNGNPVDGLPGILTPHPDDPGLLARQRSAADFGDAAQSIVTVRYATWNGAGAFKVAEPDLSGNQYLVGVDYEPVKVLIPVAYRKIIRIESDSGPVDEEVYVVDKDRSFNPTETRTISRVRWEIPNFTMSHAIAFAQQADRVHVINGRAYLFRPLSVRALDNNTYVVDATWTIDEGTRMTDDFFQSVDPDLWYPGYGMAWWSKSAPSDPTFLREPFHVVNTFSFEGFPIAYQKQIADFSQPDGWQSLPGVPPL